MGGVALAHEYDFSERAKLGEPTDAPPGSIEKLEVIHARARAGLALWHPDDRCDYRGLYCGPGIGLNSGFGFELKLLRPPPLAKPREKDKHGTKVNVGGKHLEE